MFEVIRDIFSFLLNKKDTNEFVPEPLEISTYEIKDGDVPFEWPYFVFDYFNEHEFPALKVGDVVNFDGESTWVAVPDTNYLG